MQAIKIGILGGGQLAKMLALSAKKLPVDIICFESTQVENPCAGEVTQVLSIEAPDFQKNIKQLNAVTIETENIAILLATTVAKLQPFYPSIQALEIAQDRLFEKTLFSQLDIATPQYFNITTVSDLLAALEKIQQSAVLKTRTMGYDGKGQQVIKWQGSLAQTQPIAEAAFNNLANHTPLILESFVAFDYEVSLISVRDKLGNILYYPLTKNTHQSGILILSEAPFIQEKLTEQAHSHANKILTQLDYVGVLAIEFFVKDNKLIANEMAPRVHNSGHWTIEGANTSQFENHIRAVSGFPLGSTEAIGFSMMKNIISVLPTPEQIAQITTLPGAHVHLYGKSPKPNRKLGHITICAQHQVELQKIAEQVELILKS